MFEQDYIMRQIRTMIAVIMKALFGLETTDPTLLHVQPVQGSTPDSADDPGFLLREKQYREAEEALFRRIEGNPDGLRLGLAFYDALGTEDPEDLAAHDYSSAQMADGITRLLRMYGLEKYADLFEI